MALSSTLQLKASNAGWLAHREKVPTYWLRLCLYWFMLATAAYFAYGILTYHTNVVDNAVENARSMLLPGGSTEQSEPAKRKLDMTPKKRLPKSIVVGFSKCGTRALLNYLALHPKIAAAKNEINFFLRDNLYEQGIEWYLDQMPVSAGDDVITMEKSPEYVHSETAAMRMKQLDAELKVIVAVCEPVRRSISEYTQKLHDMLDAKRTLPPFEDLVLTADKTNISTEVWYIRRSRYADYVPIWLNQFPLSQIHVVDGDALRTYPVPEVNRVERFLGLNPNFSDDHLFFNKTKGFYCIKESSGSGCLHKSKGRPHPYVDEKLQNKLRNYFRQHNKKLFKLLDKSFGWN